MARGVKYDANRGGVRDLGRESFIGDAALNAAQSVLRFARSDDPNASYAAQKTSVTVGRRNELRNGASVRELQRSEGHIQRTLVRAAQEARG